MTNKVTNEDFMGYDPYQSTGGDYECPVQAGTYDFVIHGITGLGLREQRPFEGKEKKPAAEIKVFFELPEQEGVSLREDGQTELLSCRFPVFSGNNSAYYKFCTAVLGIAITGSEDNMKKLCTATGMKELLGKTGTLTVSTWKDGVNRSVSKQGFYPSHPKAPKPVATRDTVFFNPYAPDIKVFKENLTWRTRKQIMEAVDGGNFSDALKQAYGETIAEDQANYEAKKAAGDNNSNTASKIQITGTTNTTASTVPWETNASAIQ